MAHAQIEYHLAAGLMPVIVIEGIDLDDQQKNSIRSEIDRNYGELVDRRKGKFQFRETRFEEIIDGSFDFYLKDNPTNVRGPSLIFVTEAVHPKKVERASSIRYSNDGDIVGICDSIIISIQNKDRLSDTNLASRNGFEVELNRGYILSRIILEIIKLDKKNEMYHRYLEFIHRNKLADAGLLDSKISFRHRRRSGRGSRGLSRFFGFIRLKKNKHSSIQLNRFLSEIPFQADIELSWTVSGNSIVR